MEWAVTVLGMLIELLRDLALLAAAAGVAWWTWSEYQNRFVRQDEVAKIQIAADRRSTDLMLLADRHAALIAAAAQDVAEIASASRLGEARWKDKLRVHALLQSTDDPFLTFSEIEAGLAGTYGGGDEGTADLQLGGDRLRRVLIELVADGVIAQLDRDRYFIASDFEASDPGMDESA